MSKYSICISADTPDELYASVAAYLDRPTIGISSFTPATPSAPAAAPAAGAPADADEGGTSNAEFDSAGIPWDKRIHSETRNTNKDGTWKRRRNTDDIYYASVMAELSQRTAGQQPSSPPAAPASPAAPVGIVDNGPVVIPPVPAAPAPVSAVPAPPMAAPVAAAPAIPPAPAVPAMPEAPAAPVSAPPFDVAPAVPQAAPPPAAAPAAGMDYKDFMMKLSAAMQSGRFNQDALKAYLKQWELTDVTQLATNPVQTQAFYDWLKSANLID